MKLTFHANGKLLLSGEYFVLDGAQALALPTQLGQSLEVETSNSSDNTLSWSSYDENKQLWFQGQFSLPDCHYLAGTDAAAGERLSSIFKAIKRQKPDFGISINESLAFHTHLDFPRNWGLGTSSTLIVNLANWAGVDPYQLLADTFGGSGYDIACGQRDQPLLYQRTNGQPAVQLVNFNLPFANQLYFVYLGKKQNSREGIARYREKVKKDKSLIAKISALTQQFLMADQLETFEALIETHEAIVSDTLELQRAQNLYFSDYWGAVKSLGAWGGDFVLLTNDHSEKELKHYLKTKELDTVISYNDLIKY